MFTTGQKSQRGLLDFVILWACTLHKSHNAAI